MKLIRLIEGFNTKPHSEQIHELQKLSEHIDSVKVEELEEAIGATQSSFLRNILISYLNRKKSALDILEKPVVVESYDVDVDAIRGEAFAESISQVLHELEPLIGGLAFHASTEIDNFVDSKTSKELQLLEETMQSFEDWIKVEQSARFTKVEISKVVHDEIASLQSKFGASISSTLSESLLFETDRSMFRIIISNALRNAIQATGSHNFDSNPILVNAGVTDRELWVSIIDNGTGLKEEQSVLMKSKYTTKPGNRGLGLAILNKAVTALNGEWELKNGASRGAEFHLELPNREK
ncbi:sensor histidine kinase [Vibrio splendidus]|uniref:sensor histidine kinase n=1 Tax=Vibrio splendidus TaxID=29497 RepID=UPI00352D70C0